MGNHRILTPTVITAMIDSTTDYHKIENSAGCFKKLADAPRLRIGTSHPGVRNHVLKQLPDGDTPTCRPAVLAARLCMTIPAAEDV